MSKTDHALVVMAALAEPLRKLREAGNVAVPSDELAMRAVTGCLNTKTGAWRKTKPDDEAASVLWQLVKFHRSGGSLYGWPWFADEAMRDQLDTLAVVMLGGRSSAAEAWQRAMS
jgi:hypothetical protein